MSLSHDLFGDRFDSARAWLDPGPARPEPQRSELASDAAQEHEADLALDLALALEDQAADLDPGDQGGLWDEGADAALNTADAADDVDDSSSSSHAAYVSSFEAQNMVMQAEHEANDYAISHIGLRSDEYVKVVYR